MHVKNLGAMKKVMEWMFEGIKSVQEREGSLGIKNIKVYIIFDDGEEYTGNLPLTSKSNGEAKQNLKQMNFWKHK